MFSLCFSYLLFVSGLMRGQSLVNVYEMRDVELQADVTVIFGRFHHNVMVFFIDRLNAGAQQH